MADIVICHAPADAASGRLLADAIEREGYGVSLIDAPSAAVTERIAAAGAAIVLWSEAGSASEWIRAEANVARGLRKLVQVSADGRPPPVPFDPAQSVSILTWKGEADHPAWRGIAASLLGLCGPPAKKAEPAAPATAKADAPPPSPEPESLSTPAPARGPGAMAILVVALVILAALAGAWYWLREPGPDSPPPASNEAAPQPIPPEVEDTPAPSTALPAEPAPAAPEPFDREAVVQDPSGHAVVRSAPSELGFAIARVEAGETVATYEQDGSWWRVRTADGRTGYMPATSLRPREPAAAAEPPAPSRTVRPSQAARPPAAERRPRGPRIRKENSEVMEAFCDGAGAGTPQCRTFRRQLGN